MSNQIVLKSFADLALVLRLEETPGQANTVTAAEPPSTEPADLDRVLTDLAAANATLTEASRRDHEARAAALETLAQYDALMAARHEAEQALDQARAVRQAAESLAASAFTDEARAEANRVLGIARQAEGVAAQLAEERRAEAERLASQFNLERVLAERQRRVDVGLATAREALQAGRLADAKRALEQIAPEVGDNAEVAALLQRITQRDLAERTRGAEDALWQARRECRRNPGAALVCLETLDVDGLPASLARQVFGTWAQASLRLCHEQAIENPLRYAPDPGRGAVIARLNHGGAWVVVSALGMGDGWHVGARVAERIVRQSRPLR
ncbi:MAG: hypothetical protein U0822_08180 [Anaerolineae bacterium]